MISSTSGPGGLTNGLPHQEDLLTWAYNFEIQCPGLKFAETCESKPPSPHGSLYNPGPTAHDLGDVL